MKKEKNNNGRILNYILLALIVISTIMMIIFHNNITVSYIATILMFLADIIFCLKNFKKRTLLFLFLSCFFIFLMGRQTVELIETRKVVYIFSKDISIHIIRCLYISLLSVLIGFYFVEKYAKEYTGNVKDNIKLFNYSVSKEKIKMSLQKYSKIMFIIGFALNIILIIEKVIYIQEHSYLEYYKSFTSAIPYIIRIIANIRTIAFFIFIATLPSKKQSRIPIILYFLESIMMLFIGNRGNCIINVLILIYYIVFRQSLNKNEKWIKKSYVITLCAAIPFIFAGLSLIVYIREKIPLDNFSFVGQVERFFKSIGNSVNIIGYGKLYEKELPRNTLYSFGDFIQYLKYNPIISRIFGLNHLEYYTKEYAMSGASFMHTISYFIEPEAYLNGHGYGSSYIAELYSDFKYIGVIFGNLFLGAYMAIFNKIYKKSYLLSACMLLSYNIMLFIPRAAFDYILTYVFNFTVILGIIIIVGLTMCDIFIQKGKEKLLNE
ncbi:putative uncharacterized protein [Clostridium sp. CAG:921]|nr:putative uncharacterized protein [Clostridium sp. CAG:921]